MRTFSDKMQLEYWVKTIKSATHATISSILSHFFQILMNARKEQTTALPPLLHVLTLRAASPVPVTVGIVGMESRAQVIDLVL